MESVIFAITFVSFLIPIVNTVFNPHPFQKESSKNALEKGWNNFIIIITRSFPFLTLYTQFWILLALHYKTHNTMFIAQTFSWFVFCMYHGINYFNPKFLAYHSIELVKEVVAWKPPMTRNIVIWFGLHLQHTVFPFYLHYLSYKYDIVYSKNWYAVCYSFVAMSVYLVWHLFCWHVHGIAAYPFLNEVRQEKREVQFYCTGLILMVVVNCILASMWSELLFFFIGMIIVLEHFSGLFSGNYRHN